MESFTRVNYSDLMREKQAKFVTKHLAENYDEAKAEYNLKYRKRRFRQTFFIAKLDTEFYVLPNGYMISTQPLPKIDITDDYYEIRWGTYCIWQRDHYDHHLWRCYNFNHKGVHQSERFKKSKNCPKCKSQ